MSGPLLADSELVIRCRDGDGGAWAALVERYSRYVYAIAVRVYRLPEHHAEDVFQEVFARTFEHLDDLRDSSALRPWIGQLTRRLAVDQLRRDGRDSPAAAPPEPEPADAEDAMAAVDEALVVHDALGRLPEHCQEILDRFFTRDESYETIARGLDLPAGTVASRISRCLAKLRVELEGTFRPAAPSGRR